MKHFVLLLVLVLVKQNASAETSAGDKKEATKPKVTFSPEVEAKFTAFIGKITDAKRKIWNERMKKEIEDVVKITGLNPEKRPALEAAAAQASDLCMADCSAKMSESFRKNMGQQSDEMMLQMFDQILAQLDVYAKADWFGDYVRPFDHEAWTGALQRTLTGEQLMARQKELTDRQQKFEKEIGDRLKPSLERTRKQHEQEISAKSMEIKSTLALAPDRAEKLDALAKSAVDQTVEEWRKRMLKILFSTDDTQRRQMLGENFFVGTEEKDLPSQQAVWKDGVTGLLSTDELMRLQTQQEEHKARRGRAMGQIMVALLDEKIAFTEKQRQQLQPIAERAVKAQDGLFPEGYVGYFSFAPQTFFTAAASVTEDELKPILDPIQRKHWQEGSASGMEPNRRIRAAKPTPTDAVSEDVEQSISDFLYEKSRSERKQTLALNLLKAEDAARVAGVTDQALSRLQTAARGVTEAKLAGWNTSIDQNIRSQLQGATAQNVKQRLESMEDYIFQRGNREESDKPALWEKTVKTELTEEQQAALKKELDLRTAYRDQATASIIMAEFDRKNLLTNDQWEQLAPKVAGFMKDYSPDISRMFSSSNSVPWFLQSYTMFMPFAGIPEKDFKDILNKEQWDRWIGSEEFSNCAGFWGNIRQSHEQRVKVN